MMVSLQIAIDATRQGQQQTDWPRNKRLDPLTNDRKVTWEDILSKATQETQFDLHTQKTSSVLDSRSESPIRLLGSAPKLNRCVHPQGTLGADGNKDMNTSYMGLSIMGPDSHPMDTRDRRRKWYHICTQH